YCGSKPLSTPTAGRDLGRSLMWPTAARASKPLPRDFFVVLALAGESPITSAVPAAHERERVPPLAPDSVGAAAFAAAFPAGAPRALRPLACRAAATAPPAGGSTLALGRLPLRGALRLLLAAPFALSASLALLRAATSAEPELTPAGGAGGWTADFEIDGDGH